jgi:hypothetical protein
MKCEASIIARLGANKLQVIGPWLAGSALALSSVICDIIETSSLPSETVSIIVVR